MELYPTATANAACWPGMIESGYQLLGGGEATELAPKLPHLGLADVLFMTSIMSIPRERRPWGIVTWLSDAFLLSRPALYNLAERVRKRLLSTQATGYLAVSGDWLEEKSRAEKEAEGNRNRLARTVLTAAFPGKMALRPMQQMLAESLDQSPSVGWLSELLKEASQKAKKILAEIDFSAMGPLIVLRDETFFQDHPILMLVDPVSSVIVQAVVTPDRQADTWALLLLQAQDQGVEFAGLVEDMARMYASSCRHAELKVSIQKDTWHIQRDGKRLLTALEKSALRASQTVFALEKKLLKAWDESLFLDKYIDAVALEEERYTQVAHFACWFDHFCDACEIVDLPSGAIRDIETNHWLLNASLSALETIDQTDVQKWVKSLRSHQHQLLVWMEWLTPALTAWQERLAHLLPEAQARKEFTHLVARLWRSRQALINGHSGWRRFVQETTASLDACLLASPALQASAQQLSDILDAACRTSSLIECINGLLKPFLHNRRSFPDTDSLQNYLNLFVLWHNMRVYERGKRQGQSPYQRAGIPLPSTDWLDLLGFPRV
jgi:hypothetical protein